MNCGGKKFNDEQIKDIQKIHLKLPKFITSFEFNINFDVNGKKIQNAKPSKKNQLNGKYSHFIFIKNVILIETL